MLNLLFISDSPKAKYIKDVLQPVLKVIIDVVTDFDHGLKDVFEKRPATVCIQDQIGGVTGESVARHIQMLLGNSAPTFILLHTGNIKVRAIKGLYEYIVDLGQPDDTLADDIKNTLKSLLGDQWDKIYIPPKLSAASIRSSVALPEASRKDADKLVEDFLSDLETPAFSAPVDQPPVASVQDMAVDESLNKTSSETPPKPEKEPGINEPEDIQSTNDDLADLLLTEVNEAAPVENRVNAPANDKAEPQFVVNITPKLAAASATPEPGAVSNSSTPTESLSDESIPATKTVVSTPAKRAVKSTSTPLSTPPILPAAEFRIDQKTPLAEEQTAENLLLEFEENYRSEPLFLRRSVIIILVVAVCSVIGWYLVKQKPQLVSSLKQRLMAATVAKQVPVTMPAAGPVQKPAPQPVPQPVSLPLAPKPLPAFIPKAGHDSSYALKNPGWERYVGKLNEFRLFSASGRAKAVQVLAVKDAPIAESLIKSVLQEFVGSQEYQIISRDTKAGVRIERGRIQDKGEIIIYKKNTAVKAFVVSVN